jgi:hypothetical protein
MDRGGAILNTEMKLYYMAVSGGRMDRCIAIPNTEI